MSCDAKAEKVRGREREGEREEEREREGRRERERIPPIYWPELKWTEEHRVKECIWTGPGSHSLFFASSFSSASSFAFRSFQMCLSFPAAAAADVSKASSQGIFAFPPAPLCPPCCLSTRKIRHATQYHVTGPLTYSSPSPLSAQLSVLARSPVSGQPRHWSVTQATVTLSRAHRASHTGSPLSASVASFFVAK